MSGYRLGPPGLGVGDSNESFGEQEDFRLGKMGPLVLYAVK